MSISKFDDLDKAHSVFKCIINVIGIVVMIVTYTEWKFGATPLKLNFLYCILYFIYFEDVARVFTVKCIEAVVGIYYKSSHFYSTPKRNSDKSEK